MSSAASTHFQPSARTVSAAASSFLVHELLEEKRIGEIAAPVLFEEIAHDKAARRFIGLDADETHARITGGDGVLGEKPADVMRGLKPASLLDGVPDLLLPLMIGVQGERHEKIERQGILFIAGEEFRAHACKLQALPHDGGRHAERRGDVLDALAFFRERGKGAELIERMQRLAVGVFGEAVLFLEPACLHKAGNRGVLCKPLLLDEQLQRFKTPASSLDAVAASFCAGLVEDGANA